MNAIIVFIGALGFVAALAMGKKGYPLVIAGLVIAVIGAVI